MANFTKRLSPENLGHFAVNKFLSSKPLPKNRSWFFVITNFPVESI